MVWTKRQDGTLFERSGQCNCLKCAKERELTKHHIFPVRFFKDTQKKQRYKIPIVRLCRTCHDFLELLIPRYRTLDCQDYLLILRAFLFFENGSHQSKVEVLDRLDNQLSLSGHIPLTPSNDRWKEKTNYCLACNRFGRVFRYFVFHQHFFGPQCGPSLLLCASCFEELESLTPAKRILGKKPYIYLAQSFIWQGSDSPFEELLREIGPIIKEQRSRCTISNRQHLFFPNGSVYQKLTAPAFCKDGIS